MQHITRIGGSWGSGPESADRFCKLRVVDDQGKIIRKLNIYEYFFGRASKEIWESHELIKEVKEGRINFSRCHNINRLCLFENGPMTTIFIILTLIISSLIFLGMLLAQP
jgi:hypothetical protein